MDLVQRRTPRTDGRGVLSELAAWIEQAFGHRPVDEALWCRALTHGSRTGEESYERLEFLGDRILGLSVAEWLYDLFPAEPEGMLSRRINVLVSGATCAEVAREIGAPDRIFFDKGVRGDLRDSDNVLGDVVEALLAALYLEAGLDAARGWVRRRWAARVDGPAAARKHPKAALQEWAAANRRGAPVYASVEESGPDHLPLHTVAARLGPDERTATASTKREAETAAARLLLAHLAEQQPVKRKRVRPPRTILPRKAPREMGA